MFSVIFLFIAVKSNNGCRFPNGFDDELNCFAPKSNRFEISLDVSLDVDDDDTDEDAEVECGIKVGANGLRNEVVGSGS